MNPAPVRLALLIQVMPGPRRPGSRARSVEVVDSRNEIPDFLTSRRAKIITERAGDLPNRIAYSAYPGTAAHDALNLIASCAAPPHDSPATRLAK